MNLVDTSGRKTVISRICPESDTRRPEHLPEPGRDQLWQAHDAASWRGRLGKALDSGCRPAAMTIRTKPHRARNTRSRMSLTSIPKRS